MRSTLSREKRLSGGFSLLEVIVALTLLSFGIVALVELFSASLRTVKKTDDYSRGVVYARSLMDEAYAAVDVEGLDGEFDLDEHFSAERSLAIVNTVEGGAAAAGRQLGGEAPVVATIYEIRVVVKWPPSGKVELKGTKAVYEEAE